MKRMIFNTIALGLVLTVSAACQKELGYTGFVDQDAAASAEISLSTDKAVYKAGETVNFSASSMPEGAIYVRYKHLGQQLGDEQALAGPTWTWDTPVEDYKGYMAEIYQKSASGETVLATIAIDVSSDWSKFPRYGFLATFNEMSQESSEDVIAGLNRLHINGVQFQDWHWKHHWPLAQDKTTMEPLETYIDIASRNTSLQTIRNYIASCHKYGMKAIFYNLCFGALEDAAEDGVSEEWFIFKDTGHQEKDVHTLGAPFKSSIWLTNPADEGWLSYLGERTDDIYENLGFDGYQIDQLGGRGTVYDYNGEVVDLTESYAGFINYMKDRQPEKDLIMNAVSSFGSRQILGTGKTAFAYNELWGSEAQFSDLKKVIDANISYGGENMKTVFAAYMNYGKANNPGSFNTPGILLTDAVMFALGGSHLEMGEHMLCKEYFPNSNLGMSAELENAIIAYYDFMTAYQNLLRDGGTFNDVAVSSSDGTYAFKSWEPAAGNIITLAKEVGNRQTIHFLNFLNADSTSWRDLNGTMPEPSEVNNLSVTIQLPENKTVESAWIASPDIECGASRTLAFTQEGQTVTLVVPSLKYWDMLVLEYE